MLQHLDCSKMASRPVREVQALNIVSQELSNNLGVQKLKYASIEKLEDLEKIESEHPWVLNQKLVCKSDQLVKRRAKSGLITVNSSWNEVKEFVNKFMEKDFKVGETSGKLKTFIVTPFIPHAQEEESYICIHSARNEDCILFYHAGGIDIGNVEEKAELLKIPTSGIDEVMVDTNSFMGLLQHLEESKRERVAKFIQGLYTLYKEQYFTYLEVNPLVITHQNIYILDLAAKVDSAADYLFPVGSVRGSIEYPAPFGREATAEEAKIAELDAKTGASLKLTVLNEKGRIWTMVAGGGASVIYADTIVDMGGVKELANYGEYSGAPNEQQTYSYAKTILELMCKHPHKDGKVLIIGGGIANFTNVADTFKGIMRALREMKTELQKNQIKVFVRRGGPNHLEGLRLMKELGTAIDLPIHVYGPETHMTAIVGMALGKKPITDPSEKMAEERQAGQNFSMPSMSWDTFTPQTSSANSAPVSSGMEQEPLHDKSLMTKSTTCFVFGRQLKAIQGMLDFDYVCRRATPSVCGIIDPFGGSPRAAFYWGSKQIFITIYKSVQQAAVEHNDVSVLVNFASFRSAYNVTMETLLSSECRNIKTVAIIAEGIPENMTRRLVRVAREKEVTIIGPATVGGIKPGCFRIGNTGGMMDNIIRSKLYRPGSVAYVSRSGGMSNELNNILSLHTDGVYEGVAIGGDRYPVSTFVDHLLRYQEDPKVKMMVLLGEIGGVEEYIVCDLLKQKRITKPIIAWCIGTCSDVFSTDVQFGHAGASASGVKETARAKNLALKQAGAVVPESFDDLGVAIEGVFKRLLQSGEILPLKEVAPPPVPMDYSWAREVGLIRRPAAFVTSMSDERGDELMYAGVKVSEVVESGKGMGGVMGLLWFQKDLPQYFCKFMELSLMVTADHGPAVSGAHNTIVSSRAGKDLVSSLCSGLLTIGSRFGGALNDAAEQFSGAFDRNLSPAEFVTEMRKNNKLIMGIGHRVKSLEDPDARVKLVKEFVRDKFPRSPLFDYALKVEEVTTRKRSNLILNVDGAIAVAFVDLLRESGQFTREEADKYVKMGILNGIFVLGRTTGFIGHYIDQLRLDQGLYRHPWDDISYIMPSASR